MSQFFQQTQRTLRNKGLAEAADTPIPQLLPEDGTIRENGSEIRKTSEPDILASLLKEVGAADQGLGSGASPIEKYRRVHLPRSSPNLLFPESELLHSFVAECYRRARTRLLQSQAKMQTRSVCIGSAVAGEGKTMTSANLALCCCQVPGLRVLLVDADLRTAGLSRLLGFGNAPGLAELLRNTSTREEAIAAADVDNLYLLPAGSASAPAELFAGTEWKEFIQWATHSFDVVIIDTPPILPLTDTELILAACDGLLLVARALQTPRETITKAVEKFESKKLLGAIFNGTNIARRGSSEYNYYGKLAMQRPAKQKP